MQRRHSVRHLFWRSGVALISHVMMFTGLYPLVPHAVRRTRPARAAFVEWAAALAVSVLRPAGFLPLPGARGHGPRPVIVLHGYAMNRANFVGLAYRLKRAGLGPVLGFEYWTLGRTGAAARQLAQFVDIVLAGTGAKQVDIIGHSMGGIVARYYVTLAGGDGKVANLITLGSPHYGTDVSKVGIGYAMKEMFVGSKMLQRMFAAPPPEHTHMTVIWSHADALVPAATQPHVPGADEIIYDDLGHVSLLASRRVADEIISRLKS
ncbi:MAG TPA: alpha/beta fold hydrolase [Kofleriaceae bacterium]|jgi:triacylglycerol esterase/lipase EstA (alpha/beta hydrolase family)|nr:alpha/beta fold hydrolase [Kofleriaceae bacterium]